MKSRKIHFLLTATSALLLAQNVHAQTISWKAGGNNLWSNTVNWDTGVVPNSNSVDARFSINNNVQINVDGPYTVKSYGTGFAANVSNVDNEHLVYGDTLTIDRNNGTAGNGITHASNNNIKLKLGCDVTINNAGFPTIDTYVVNQNGANNTIEFGNNCALTLTTKLRTNTNLGSIVFNCTFSPSAQDLLIGSNNVSFGPTHISTNFQRDIILFANSKLAVNAAAGTVLTANRKFQINGTGAEVELNTADSINNANIVVGGSNTLLLDVKTNQGTMGDVRFTGGAADGVLTIDIDPAVTSLAFANCSAQVWSSGTITINGFKENTIRFGTDNTGLTVGQLAAINGGIYTLSPTGFLTGTPAVNNYASWAADPLKGNIPGEPATGDFDNDGITNLIEYALGTNPRVSTQPPGALSGNTITFTKGGDAIANDDVSWTIETSETLLSGSWTDAVVQPNTNNDPTISYDLAPAPGTPKKFARLRVVETP